MLRRLDIGRAWQHARQQFAALVAERDHLREELRRVIAERDEFRRCAAELCAATLARVRAEDELRELRREHAIQRAWAQERGTAPLN
jgi:hypothetical protein